MKKLTHFNEEGRAKMVDVSGKPETVRTAVAQSQIEVNMQIYEHINTNQIKKGDVLAVSQVAGIMAAKKTWEIIPMCHPIPLKGIDITFQWQEGKSDSMVLEITASVKTIGNTGVEMRSTYCSFHSSTYYIRYV